MSFESVAVISAQREPGQLAGHGGGHDRLHVLAGGQGVPTGREPGLGRPGPGHGGGANAALGAFMVVPMAGRCWYDQAASHSWPRIWAPLPAAAELSRALLLWLFGQDQFLAPYSKSGQHPFWA